MGMIEDDYQPRPDGALSRAPRRNCLTSKIPRPKLVISRSKLFEHVFGGAAHRLGQLNKCKVREF